MVASSSSVGDFSRMLQSSLTASRTTLNPSASYNQRSTLQTKKDPLSLIGTYVKQQASKTPVPHL